MLWYRYAIIITLWQNWLSYYRYICLIKNTAGETYFPNKVFFATFGHSRTSTQNMGRGILFKIFFFQNWCMRLGSVFKKKYFKQYTPPNILCTCPGVSKRHEKHLVGKICFTRRVLIQTYVSMITHNNFYMLKCLYT